MDTNEHIVNADGVQASPIGARIREERLRLGLSQASFAKRVGVHRRTQVNYELGQRKPDTDYLEAAARNGMDMVYVLSGTSYNDTIQVYSEALDQIKARLGIYNGLHGEWEAALEAIRDDRRAFLADRPPSDEGARAINSLLRRSPFLLWGPAELGDLIERVEFVAETGGLRLSASQKAGAVWRLFDYKKRFGVDRVDLAMVKAAIERES